MTAPSVAPTHKTCSKCHISKPLDAFRLVSNHGAQHKPYAHCRDCERAWHRNRRGSRPLYLVEHPLLRTCTKCHETKAITDFIWVKRQSRHHSHCRCCRSTKSLQYHHANKERRNLATKERRARHRPLKVVPILAEKTCTKCGECKPLDMFRFVSNHGAPLVPRSVCSDCEQRAKKLYEANTLPARRLYRAHYEAHKRVITPERKAHQKQWAQENRPRLRHYGSLRRARVKGLPSTFTEEEQHFCRAYFHYACAICGKEEGFQWTLVMDHWIPINSANCPGTVSTNMIPLCNGVSGCNTSKQDTPAEHWLIRRFGKHKASAILRKIDAYFAAVRERFHSTR